MISRFALVASVALLAATPAGADGPYVALEGGASFFRKADVTADGVPGSVNLLYDDPGFNVQAAAGMRLSDYLRGEVALSYRRADTDKIKGDEGQTLGLNGDVGIFAAMGNVYIDFDLGLPVMPYLGTGIGVGVIFADVPIPVFGSDSSDVQVAFNGMAGLAYLFDEKWMLTGGYRYFGTDDANIDQLDIPVGVHEVMLGVRYEF